MTAVSVPVPSTPPTATAYSYMINGGDQDHKGAELALKYSIVKDGNGVFSNITPFLNVTYSDFTYGDNFIYKSGTTTSNWGIDTLNYSGLDVFGTPKLMTAVGIDMAMNNGLYLNISHLYRDGVNIALEKTQTYPLAEGFTLRKASAYYLVNSKIGFKRSLSGHFDLDAFFGVNNITGERYPIMIFINQLPDAYIPAPPKAVFYGGLNLKYTFGK
jgi:iron complex outermembrane receptor protein